LFALIGQPDWNSWKGSVRPREILMQAGPIELAPETAESSYEFIVSLKIRDSYPELAIMP